MKVVLEKLLETSEIHLSNQGLAGLHHSNISYSGYPEIILPHILEREGGNGREGEKERENK